MAAQQFDLRVGTQTQTVLNKDAVLARGSVNAKCTTAGYYTWTPVTTPAGGVSSISVSAATARDISVVLCEIRITITNGADLPTPGVNQLLTTSPAPFAEAVAAGRWVIVNAGVNNNDGQRFPILRLERGELMGALYLLRGGTTSNPTQSLFAYWNEYAHTLGSGIVGISVFPALRYTP